jgi:hypothetical protein
MAHTLSFEEVHGVAARSHAVAHHCRVLLQPYRVAADQAGLQIVHLGIFDLLQDSLLEGA